MQIANYIKINKASLSTDLLLREIDDFDREDDGGKCDLVSKWKNNDKLPLKIRKPRIKKPTSTS
jgi:hypothetical protein